MAALIIYFIPVLIALYILTGHFLNRLRKLPPSPFPCVPIFGHPHLLKRPIYRTFSKISSELGPVILLHFGSRKVLVVSSPSAVEECFAKNDIIFANRPGLMAGKHFGQNFTTLAWAPYGDHWRNLRRISSLEILSAYRLQRLYHIRQDEINLFLRRLFKNQDQTVDMKTAFFELTLNIMMRMIAGKRYYGENVSDMEEAMKFRAIHRETFELNGTFNIGDFVPWIKSRELEKKFIECQRKRDDFMQYLIDEQLDKMNLDDDDGSGEKERTMIQVLLSLQEKEPDYYTNEIIRGLMLVLIIGATDSLVTTMEWALSLLHNHPEVLKKAQMEIEDRIGHHHLVDEADLSQLPYLRCIVNETMRMYPPTPLLVPHESSAECVVGGYRVPRGTMLFVNIWAIQNDPKVWEDPEKFNPERFQDLEGARYGFRFAPFGCGRRSCPGEGLGLRVAELTLAALIQCFEWKTPDGKMVDMSTGLGLTLPKAEPLNVLCRPRSAIRRPAFSPLKRTAHVL